MAIAALALWMCTVAVGAYLLATATPVRDHRGRARGTGLRLGRAALGLASRCPRPGDAGPRQGPLRPAVAAARAERVTAPLRALVEFAHPALAMIGLGFWFGYVVSRDRLFLAIGLGIMLGAIAAGLSWFTVNTRAVKRVAAAEAAGQPGIEDPRFAPQAFSPRVLILHGVGAALTLLIATLITVRV